MLIQAGYSQSCNPLPLAKPNFKILDLSGNSINKICLGSAITFQDLSNGGCNIHYEVNSINKITDTVNSPLLMSRPYIYPQPGNYVITQVGSFVATGKDTSLNFQVLNYPTFQVSTCSGLNIEIKVDDIGYDSYSVDFGDGTVPVTYAGTSINHTYLDKSPKKIIVTGNLISCNLSSAKMIIPIQNIIKPTWIDVNRTNPALDIIRFNNIQSNLNYQIFQKNLNSNSQKIIKSFSDTSLNSIILQIPNLDSNSIYQYYIRAYTDCNQEALSDIIQTIPLRSLSSTNKITLNWTPYSGDGFIKYQISKNGKPLTESAVQNQNTLIDSDIICNKKYCYQLITILKNNIFSYSAFSCSEGVSNNIPSSLGDVTASIEKDKVVISWPVVTTSTVKNYLVSINNSVIATLSKPSYNESKIINSPVCYQVYYEDSCGNKSSNTNVCPVFISKPNNELIWNEYKGWFGGVKSYSLEVLDENSFVKQILYTGLNLNFNLPEFDKSQQIFRFRIKTIGNKAGLISYSNIFYWEQGSRLSIPTAFTPNGDNLNPEFRADGVFIKFFDLTIYNRWGQVIFASNDINKGWDGNIKNQPAPIDSYVYNIDAVDFAGKTIKRSGTFALVR